MEINIISGIEAKQNKMAFDDALKLTKFGKFNYMLIFLGGMVMSIINLETIGIGFVLPIAECDLKLTTNQKGIISTAALIGIILSSHFWGFLADTTGRQKVMAPSLFLSSMCSYISGFSTNVWFLVLFRFLSGVFLAGASAVVLTYVSEFHSIKYRTKAIMGVFSVFGVSYLIVSAAAWVILNHNWEIVVPILSTELKSWRCYLIFCATPSFLCSICFFLFPESPKFILLDGDEEKAISIIKRVYIWNGGSKDDDLNIFSLFDENSGISVNEKASKTTSKIEAILKSMWQQTKTLFHKNHRRMTVIACGIEFGIVLVSHGVYMWYPDISDRVSQFSEKYPDEHITICEILDKVGTFNDTKNYEIDHNNSSNILEHCRTQLDFTTYINSFIVELIYAIGFAFTNIFDNYFGKLPFMLFYAFSCGIACILIIFSTLPKISLYLFVIILLPALVLPIANAITVDHYPTSIRAMGISVTLLMSRIGCIVGTFITGYLMRKSCETAFGFLALDLFICGVLAIFLPNITKRS